MRFLTRSLIGLVLLCTTLGLLGAAGLVLSDAISARNADGPGNRPARERVYAATVQTLTPDTITPTLSVFGEVRGRRTLEVRAPAGGQVVYLHPAFEEGGQVASGDVLLRIDPEDAETALRIAETDLAEAEAELRDARRALSLAQDELTAASSQLALRQQALERQRRLQDRGVGTDAAVEDALFAESAAQQTLLARRQAIAAAEARIDLATTRLTRRQIERREAERALEDTTVLAAFDGTLAEITSVEGGLVTANERLANLVDPRALEVAFRVSATQFLRLTDRNGALRAADVGVSLDVLGEALTTPGRLSRAAAVVGEGQTGRLLFASLSDSGALRPGDFVTVHVPEPPLEAVALLPATAVAPDGGVLLLGADDRLEAARIEVLRRQGDDVIVQVGGHAGREVVLDRSPVLGTGIRVRPVRLDQRDDLAAAAPEMLVLDPARRARLIAFVEGATGMPAAARDRVLRQLTQEQVPASVVTRLESRMGG